MIALLLVVIISGGYVFFLFENIRNFGPKKIVYYATDLKKVGPLIAEYLIKDGDWYKGHPFIELGGGLAPLARYIGSTLSIMSLISVEWARSLTFVGILKNIFSKRKVLYVRCLIDEYKIPSSSILYCYLSEEIVTELYRKGAFEGCLIFSLTFKITDYQPSEELSFAGWQSPLWVYDFR